MSTLTNEKCTACRRDSPQVTEAEIRDLKRQVPDWTLGERESIQRLEHVFRFGNFAEALSFTNRVDRVSLPRGDSSARIEFTILARMSSSRPALRVFLFTHRKVSREFGNSTSG
jgi:hypothetical protein